MPPPFVDQTIASNEGSESLEWFQTGEHEAKETMFPCRYGKSGNKPHCDGSHMKTGWSGKD